MSKPDLLGPWVRRFLLEYLVGERHFAENTRQSYRDTLALLIPFVATATKTTVDRLRTGDLTADRVREFLNHLEQARACRVTTRNQRLAALHSLARFIGARSPEHLAWCSEICSIPFKKAPHEGVCYLEKHEMDALLDAPDIRTRQGLPRPHGIALPVQLRCPGERSRRRDGGRPGSAGRASGVGAFDGQGLKGAPMPPLGKHGRRAEGADRRSPNHRTGLRQSPRPRADAVRRA